MTFVGGILTTANPVYTATELEHQLKDSKATYLITSSQLLPHVSINQCTKIGDTLQTFHTKLTYLDQGSK
jgi:hypothetical protein